MDATIIICTRNRAKSLERTLNSIVAARHPAGFHWRVLVVNNGSSDNTETVIDSFRNRLPISMTFEAEPGLSRARNHGLRLAEGKHIIWTDDDVLVDPEWLNAYADAFRRWPDAAFFGGKILPVFDPPQHNGLSTMPIN